MTHLKRGRHLQGNSDPRVPKEEAEQVVALLKKEGKTVDAHFYPNEGHGFEKRENQIDSIRRTVSWFDKYLKGINGLECIWDCLPAAEKSLRKWPSLSRMSC